MRRALLLLPATIALAAPLQSAPDVAPRSSGNSIAPAIGVIDGYFRRFQQDAHVPGIVWGVVRDGRLVHLGSSGVQDLERNTAVSGDTLFRIASMSKAFTALAVLKLRDEGQLSLDAPAETYVPEMRGWTYPTSDSPRIRVRDLLNHVAGFVTDDPWGDRQTPLTEEDFTRFLAAGVPFSRTPQSAYEYSNLGYAVLGRVIGNVSGRPYADYIQREIMRPLGMATTGYDVFQSPQARRAFGYRWENGSWAREPDMKHGAFGAMGGVQTSAQDYARWVAFLLSGWPPRNAPEEGPVRRSTVRELAQGSNFLQITPRQAPSAPPCSQAAAYGMGLRIAADCDLGLTLAHGGGYPGYGSYVLLLPDYGVGIFAFANRTYGAPIVPVWDTALELHRSGLLSRRPLPIGKALADSYAAAGAIYREGDVAAAQGRVATNFLMDRSRENWARELSRLKAQLGECDTAGPLTATGTLSGTFTWACARGRMTGQLLLAPTNPPAIQALRLQVQP